MEFFCLFEFLHNWAINDLVAPLSKFPIIDTFLSNTDASQTLIIFFKHITRSMLNHVQYNFTLSHQTHFLQQALMTPNWILKGGIIGQWPILLLIVFT